MKRYMPCGCCKCDFSEGQSIHLCKKGFCNSYEEGYFVSEIEDGINIGYVSIEEFNEAFGTNYKESK